MRLRWGVQRAKCWEWGARAQAARHPAPQAGGRVALNGRVQGGGVHPSMIQCGEDGDATNDDEEDLSRTTTKSNEVGDVFHSEIAARALGGLPQFKFYMHHLKKVAGWVVVFAPNTNMCLGKIPTALILIYHKNTHRDASAPAWAENRAEIAKKNICTNKCSFQLQPHTFWWNDNKYQVLTRKGQQGTLTQSMWNSAQATCVQQPNCPGPT